MINIINNSILNIINNLTLNIIFELVSIFGVGVLLWYTIETFKIRRTSERQLTTSVRPYLSYLQDPINFTVKNSSNFVALNVFLLTKINGQYKLSKETESISAIASGDKYTFTRAEMCIITENELLRRIPSIRDFIAFIGSKTISCLCVVYEDINMNKLYTIHYGSGDSIDQAGVTGYVSDLE